MSGHTSHRDSRLAEWAALVDEDVPEEFAGVTDADWDLRTDAEVPVDTDSPVDTDTSADIDTSADTDR